MDIPKPGTIDTSNFKLAKVGKDRERKRGGAAWWMGGRGAGSFLGAGGGAGGLAGVGAFKTLLALAMVLGVCATGVVLGLASLHSGSGSGKGDKIFASKDSGKYDDLSGVVKTNNNIPNSLGYVSGTLDGMTPEERARKKAEEEARLAAEEAARKKAEEDAAKQAAAAPPPAPAAPAAPANTGGGGGSLAGNKFGRLSGGLSGGSGLSGGIGGSFSKMGGPSGFGDKGKKGTLSSALASTAVQSSHGAARPMGAGRGQAFGQLRRTAASGNAALGKSGVGAATEAGSTFDANTGGSSIDGAGLSSGPGNGDTPPGGGPGASPGGGPGGGPGDGGPPAPTSPSVPWQAQLDAALIALGVIVAGAIAAAIAYPISLSVFPPTAAAGQLALRIADAAICVAAATLVGIGIDLMAQYGQMMQGGVLIACGVVCAAMCWANPYVMLAVNAIAALGAGGMLLSASSSVSQSSSSASQINTK